MDRYGPNGLILIGTNEAKATCFSLLRQSIAGSTPRPLTWPADESRYGPLEFEGICSESLRRTLDKRTGATSLMWKKIGRNNEALDLLVYSLAAVNTLGIGFVLREAEAIQKGDKMGSLTPTIHHLEYGEDAVWTAPAGATRWLAWRRTELQPVHNATQLDAGGSGYGGSPPAWTEIGGFDITADSVITAEEKDSGVQGFSSIATAAGVTIKWAALMELADGLDTEVVQLVAYDGDGPRHEDRPLRRAGTIIYFCQRDRRAGTAPTAKPSALTRESGECRGRAQDRRRRWWRRRIRIARRARPPRRRMQGESQMVRAGLPPANTLPRAEFW